MVNEDFKRELRRLLIDGLEEGQAASAMTWTSRETPNERAEASDELFMLTISSQLFRVIILMHFSRNELFERAVMEALKINNNVLEADKFYDFVGEVGNAVCGAVKRELGRTVPSLGMSTPNRLSQECMKYIRSLKIDFQTHAEVLRDGERLFAASLYLCADHDLDYRVSVSAPREDDVASGELEFF